MTLGAFAAAPSSRARRRASPVRGRRAATDVERPDRRGGPAGRAAGAPLRAAARPLRRPTADGDCSGCASPVGNTGRRRRRGQGRRACARRSSAPTCCSACDGGRFVSVIDPPARRRRGGRRLPAAPLLAGARRRGPDGQTRTSCWSSPIILSDHPSVAPESAGRAVRLHRDRRDPHPAGDDADRRREGRRPGPPTRGRPRSSTAASDVPGGAAAAARHPARPARTARAAGADRRRLVGRRGGGAGVPGDRRRPGRRHSASQRGSRVRLRPEPARRRPGHVPRRPGGRGQRGARRRGRGDPRGGHPGRRPGGRTARLVRPLPLLRPRRAATAPGAGRSDQREETSS